MWVRDDDFVFLIFRHLEPDLYNLVPAIGEKSG